MPIFVSCATQILCRPSGTLASAVRPAMIQQSPKLPCLTSPPLTFFMKVGFSKISCTRLTALGTAALELSSVVLFSSNFCVPRLFKQCPFSYLRSQSWSCISATFMHSLGFPRITYQIPTRISIPHVYSLALFDDLFDLSS